MSLPKLNPVEPPWYGPVCPVVGEGWHREVSPYPDYLRVSQINNCAYCLDTHTRDLLRKGQSVEKLALVQAW